MSGRDQMLGVRPYRSNTVFEVSLLEGEVEGRGCQLQMWCRRRRDGEGLVVDWGDGSVDTWTATGQFTLWHTFTGAGTFTVTLGENLSWFRLVDAYTLSERGPLVCRPNVHPVQWGDMVESAFGTYCGWNRWYGDGLGVWGEPIPWGASITNVMGCYERSRSIVGPPAAWNDSITDCTNCYRQTGVSGRIAHWPSGMKSINGCYAGAGGMTGRIPPWPPAVEDIGHVFEDENGIDVQEIPPYPDTVRDMSAVFKGNVKVVGEIPPWPKSLEWANEAYAGCKKLSGAWTRDPAALMPENVEHHLYTVDGANWRLATLFTPEWGGRLDPENEEDGVMANVVGTGRVVVERNDDGDFVVSLVEPEEPERPECPCGRDGGGEGKPEPKPRSHRPAGVDPAAEERNGVRVAEDEARDDDGSAVPD